MSIIISMTDIHYQDYTIMTTLYNSQQLEYNKNKILEYCIAHKLTVIMSPIRIGCFKTRKHYNILTFKLYYDNTNDLNDFDNFLNRSIN